MPFRRANILAHLSNERRRQPVSLSSSQTSTEDNEQIVSNPNGDGYGVTYSGHVEGLPPKSRTMQLTRVLLSSLGILLLLLLIFTSISISESASLIKAPAPSTSSRTSSNYNYMYRRTRNNENNRLLGLSSSNSYVYRVPRTTPPTTPNLQYYYSYDIVPAQTPKVLVRLSGESGFIPQSQQFQAQSRRDSLIQKSALSRTIPIAQTDLGVENKPEPDSARNNDKSQDDQPEYPYHFYLDYYSKSQTTPPQHQSKSEFLSPLPSETFKPLPQYQSNIWSDFISHQVQESATIQNVQGADDITQSPQTPTQPPQFLNEIENFGNHNYNPDPMTVDNYTIPSLRDYKFPEFKYTTSTTKKPAKPDYLNPYEFFSEEDLENVADLDLDGDHSKYFVKTKPRDVSSSIANLYNSFYYEPPSYSTKTQPLPVKAKFPLADSQSQKADKLNFNSLFTKDFNYYDGTVTFPMSSTTTPTPTITTTQTTAPITAKLKNIKRTTTTTPSVLNQEFQFTSTTPTSPTSQPVPVQINLASDSIYSHTSVAHPKSDVSTAESISILSSRSVNPENANGLATPSATAANFNLIPDVESSTNPLLSTTTDATSIPGMPGIDYPIFDEIPVTNFDCQKQRYKGFFADIETKCQAWHYCDFTDGHSTFLCPNGTLFSQVLLTCDWWFNVDCKQAQQLYVLNERLYRYIKPPKPSFPEDYHGPQVDLWLKKQLELGLLPKIKKKGKLVDKPVALPPTATVPIT